MAISKVNFNSLNVTPSASKFLAWDGDADALAAANIGGAMNLIATATGNGNDESASGFMHLFDPSNTTFVKHFISRGNCQDAGPMSRDAFAAGYVNTTSAVDAVQFKMSSGNIDSGVIKMYGVS